MYKDKDFTGIWTPVEVLKLANIGTTQKYILSIITALDQSNDGCYASNRYIAGIMKITRGRVSEIITELHRKELITYVIDQKAKHIRIIRPLIDIKAKPLTSMENTLEAITENPNSINGNSLEAIRENPKHNNKDYNKENKKDERELSHFDYFKSTFPDEYEKLNNNEFKRIFNPEEFKQGFNNKMLIENFPRNKTIYPRLQNFCRGWIKNQNENDRPTPSSFRPCN